MQQLTVQLVALSLLKPHEEIVQAHTRILIRQISLDQAIRVPVMADTNSKVILDGHHRVKAAEAMRLVKIPCLLVDYYDDSVIAVFSRRKEIHITKKNVIDAGIAGTLFPHKTTRHLLYVSFQSLPIGLSRLQ